jgi:hypothetical protein
MTAMVVDFDEVRRNAASQGIALDQIAIFYKGLTADEMAELERRGLVARKTESVVIGKFLPDGGVLFPERATGVYSLSA